MILRYPGGKSRGPLHKKIVSHIVEHSRGVFCEPFFGGGGITFGLLKSKAISSLVMCEKDTGLLNLWHKVIKRPDLLIRSVKSFSPSVSEFQKRKELLLSGKGSAFDFLVVNRLSHGGRGTMSGPQGGLDQKSKYKIDCRWNPERLCKYINLSSDLLNSVEIRLKDDYRTEADYYYFDPPYYEVGDQLYPQCFSESDHRELRQFVTDRRFLLSYNNHPWVKESYRDYKIEVLSTSGNGGAKKDSEVLIYAS